MSEKQPSMLTGEMFNRISETSPETAHRMADRAGVSIGEIRALVFEGILGVDALIDALAPSQPKPRKLSEQLERDDKCGDFGKALEGYDFKAEELERVLKMCYDDMFKPSGKISKKTAIELMKIRAFL